VRRLSGAALLLLAIVLFLTSLGCKQHAKRVAAAEREELFLSSMISTADPLSAGQFTKGFYPIDPGVAWRWTSKEFTVSLTPPRGAGQKGAQLVLDFTLPDAVIKNLKSMTLSASIRGLKLAPENYTAAGAYSYTRDVPAENLKSANIAVDFALDKVLPPSGAETRELGIIVSKVGFKIK